MKKSRNEVMVGMFVIIGFIMLSLVVFFVSGVYLFRAGYQVSVMYDYVSILDKGAPVRMAGVRIGEVSKVDLVYDTKVGKTRVEVKLFIEKGVEIRENYLFIIQGTHILSEPHIEVSPQPGNAQPVKKDQVLEGVSPVPIEKLIERGHQIVNNLDEIFQNMRDAFVGEGTEPALKDIVSNLASLTHSLEIVFSGSEDQLKGAIHNIDSTSSSLKKILDKMESGEGTVGRLFMDDALYEEMRAFVAEIKAHPWKLMKKS